MKAGVVLYLTSPLPARSVQAFPRYRGIEKQPDLAILWLESNGRTLFGLQTLSSFEWAYSRPATISFSDWPRNRVSHNLARRESNGYRQTKWFPSMLIDPSEQLYLRARVVFMHWIVRYWTLAQITKSRVYETAVTLLILRSFQLRGFLLVVLLPRSVFSSWLKVRNHKAVTASWFLD